MIAITVDCEQWSAPALRGKDDSSNNSVKYSFEGNKKLLEILDKRKIKATFFVTGFFAEKEKEQVKEIAKKHEIASHGYNHLYRGNNNFDLFEDISKSKKIIEKIIKRKIIGFRAPQMQFSKKLIKNLEKLNFKYDSSIHSAWLPGFYNNKDKPLSPFKVGKIIEIPASASLKLRIPFSWMFMRNFPLSYSVGVIKNLLKEGIIPVIFVHSWEFFEFKNKNVPKYLTRNTGKKFCYKFEKLLEHFRDEKFVTMGNICDDFK